MAVLSCLPPCWLRQWIVLSCLKIQDEEDSLGLGDIGQWFDIGQSFSDPSGSQTSGSKS